MHDAIIVCFSDWDGNGVKLWDPKSAPECTCKNKRDKN